MSNSHWYHFFFHDDFGVIRSKINFFSGGKVCLVVASGGGGGGMCPFRPPLGPALKCMANLYPFCDITRIFYFTNFDFEVSFNKI